MKTIIIGLDGATFDIIKPLASAGRLPVLSRLMKEGATAPLRSTILPNSFPGWASCTTGTSEGMHGVFSPFIKNQSSYGVRAMSGRDIMTRPVWDILTEHSGRSIVLNVPTTYPPEPINGLMVTGMLTPGRGSEFTHPSSLRNELLAEFPNYVIEPERIPDKLARANEFRRTIEVRERALKFLMQKSEWDFLMVVFSVLDRAQHDYWADMDPSHPRHDPNTPPEFREFIHEIYQRLDLAVGNLIEQLPADSRVLVVSDHGFCSELFEVRVNELLASAGLLAFKSPAFRKSVAGLRSFKDKVARRISPAVANGNVWVNLAGREPEGIVRESDFDGVIEECRSALVRLTSPEDGEPVFESVMRRDEAFNGAWSSRLPDLVMVTRRDEYVYNERPGYGEVIVPADSTTGTHSRDGIFIAWGRGVEPSGSFTTLPNLRDVGPTALASLGCPLTTDMDGRPVMEVFADVSEPMRQGTSYKQAADDSAVSSVYNAAEEASLRERLRALGYIE